MSRCCGTSVGVVIINADGHLLMITRGWEPWGIAPVAGHVADEHATPEEAARAETNEEVGLTLTSSRLAWSGHVDNLCSAPPASPPGHRWWLYTGTATGTLRPAAEETRGAAWYTPAQVQDLAHRTIDHANGLVHEEEFAAAPGLEAVWLEHLHRLDLLRVDDRDLEIARGIYTTPPTEYWEG